jgi:hypothetical protein
VDVEVVLAVDVVLVVDLSVDDDVEHGGGVWNDPKCAASLDVLTRRRVEAKQRYVTGIRQLEAVWWPCGRDDLAVYDGATWSTSSSTSESTTTTMTTPTPTPRLIHSPPGDSWRDWTTTLRTHQR